MRRSKQRTEDAQDEGRWTGAGTKSEVIKTAIYHFEAKVISRGAGRSAVAAAAYQSGEQLYNDYDGITHDYTKKTGVLFSEILLPDMAPAEWADRQTLWNAVEQAEKAKDSRLARQLIVALPTELTMQDWQAMLHQFVLEECVAKGMCADFAIHDTDGHNPHAHIMLTVRPLDANGKWQAKTQKEYLCRRGEEKGFTAAEFRQAQSEGWENEVLTMDFCSGTLQSFLHRNPIEASNASDVRLFLLPFDEVKDIFEKTITLQVMTEDKNRLISVDGGSHYRYPSIDAQSAEITITKVQLGYMCMPDSEGSDTEAVLIPVWDFYGTWTSKEPEYEYGNGEDGPVMGDVTMDDAGVPLLTIDARDGSVIQRIQAGWAASMGSKDIK